MEKRKWTEKEKKALYKFLRQGKSAKEIAQSLSRSEKAIRVKVETGSLACLGCGHEHNCSVSGCAIIRAAIIECLKNEKEEK